MEKKPLDTKALNELSAVILDAAITVHREMGPGLLESVYHHCMIHELRSRGLQVDTMVQVPLHYKGEALNKNYIIDVLVQDEIILEFKTSDGILPVHEAQIISYLKLAAKRLGFIVNFHERLLKQGFRRFVYKL